MNAKEFVAKLALVDQERLALIFSTLSAFVPEARLLSGERLVDATDFKAWLQELADELEVRR